VERSNGSTLERLNPSTEFINSQGEPVEQLRMRRRRNLGAESFSVSTRPRPKLLLPDPIRHDARVSGLLVATIQRARSRRLAFVLSLKVEDGRRARPHDCSRRVKSPLVKTCVSRGSLRSTITRVVMGLGWLLSSFVSRVFRSLKFSSSGWNAP